MRRIELNVAVTADAVPRGQFDRLFLERDSKPANSAFFCTAVSDFGIRTRRTRPVSPMRRPRAKEEKG